MERIKLCYGRTGGIILTYIIKPVTPTEWSIRHIDTEKDIDDERFVSSYNDCILVMDRINSEDEDRGLVFMPELNAVSEYSLKNEEIKELAEFAQVHLYTHVGIGMSKCNSCKSMNGNHTDNCISKIIEKVLL